MGWGVGWGREKSVTSSTASLSKSVPHSGSICHTPSEHALGVYLERKREDCQLFRGRVPVRALKAAVQPGAGGGPTVSCGGPGAWPLLLPEEGGCGQVALRGPEKK